MKNLVDMVLSPTWVGFLTVRRNDEPEARDCAEVHVGAHRLTTVHL